MAAALTSNCLIAGFLTPESQNPFSHYARKNITRQQLPLTVQARLHAPAMARQIFGPCDFFGAEALASCVYSSTVS